MVTDEDVAEFVSMTGARADEAHGYLEMAGGSLQQAVSLFLEMGGVQSSPAARPAPSPASPPGYLAGGVVDAEVAAEVAAAAAAAGVDMGPAHLPDAHMADAEVRAPMAAFQDQIINPSMERRRMQEAIAADTAAMSRRMTFDRPVDAAGAGAGGEGDGAAAAAAPSNGTSQAMNQLFAPPSYNEAIPYLQVIEKAKAEGKWVLVNIQQAEVFASHTLNRDVWSDDTIKDVIGGSFLFWQRDDKSAEGDSFCQYYQCGHRLPHVCIIDPRTRRRVKSWDGRKWVESYLFGFLDEFSMSRSPASSPALRAQGTPMAGATVEEFRLTGLDESMEGRTPTSSAAGITPAVSRADVAAPEADAAMEPPKEPAAAMPAEPPDTVEHVKVSFRLPSGQRVTRRFLPASLVEEMFAVASALADQPLSSIDLATQFPKRLLRDVEGGLGSTIGAAQVAGSLVVVSPRT